MRGLWLIWAGLARDPLRVALTTGSVAVAFVLFWLLKGVDSGLVRQLESIPDDLLEVRGRSFPSQMPLANLYQIEEIAGVVRVAQLAYHNSTYRDFRGGVPLLAVDIDRYLDVAHDLRIEATAVAAFRKTPGAAIVGAGSAERFGWKVGDRIRLDPIGMSLSEWSFEMVGTWTHATGFSSDAEGLIVDFEHMDRMQPEGWGGHANGFVVRIDDPKRAGAVAAAIDGRLANSPAPTLTARVRDVSISGQHAGQVRMAANSIVGASLFAILFCTAGAMAQSARDRYRELAVMKSLGFGSAALAFGIAGESVAICTVGALLGLIPAALVDLGALMGRPYGAMIHPPAPSLYAIGFGVSLLLAAISVLPPVWRVLRLSPAELRR